MWYDMHAYDICVIITDHSNIDYDFLESVEKEDNIFPKIELSDWQK